ncbi:hypothetical protein PsorP6_002572 [Peronosclerospora sorghi]|uniref:Uncharacterized protein n=1 Tax=Peronosclerospora sorghi TaxID=230839 RepID=A0ACC0WRH2_9STRA|nr:hypothetical protein PsorP6_002572 [Peronosclerospora sorghi]
MQQANERFELLHASRVNTGKGSYGYEGKYGEDIELWIFATELYYANKLPLMEADSWHFVTIISSNLGKSVLNWYRAFVAEFEHVNMHEPWSLFKSQLRLRFRPNGFEYDLRERIFRLKQKNSIQDDVYKYQELMLRTQIAISEMEKLFYFHNGLQKETAKRSNKRVLRSRPPYKKHKSKEANRFMSVSVYAILEVQAKAYVKEDQKHGVSIFIDSGSRSVKN